MLLKTEILNFIVVQFSSVTQLWPTLCDPMDCSMPHFPVHHQLPELAQTNVHQVSDAIQPSHPLLSPSPPAPNPSQHQSLFQWVNSSHDVAEYWSFSFSIIPSKEIPGLISFRMDCLDRLAVTCVWNILNLLSSSDLPSKFQSHTFSYLLETCSKYCSIYYWKTSACNWTHTVQTYVV